MKKLLLALALAMSSPALWAQSPIFSLDDDPSAPFTGPFFGFGFSAEDPLACTGIQLGPSPSLGLGILDSDVLAAGPGVVFPIPGASYVDSLSTNHAWNLGPNISQFFSVDRIGQGNCGALAAQAGVWDQPGDIFQSGIGFTNPNFFIGALPPGGCYVGTLPTAGTGGCPNFLVTDQAALGLASAGVPPFPFSHDNVDGVDYWLPGNPISPDIYYTLHPSESIVMGMPTGNIWFGPPGAPFGTIYAKDSMIGLNCTSFGIDNIDGLVVMDNGALFPQPAEPGIDGALFSLSPCSGTIRFLQSLGFPADGGTVFFTDFQGSFAVYLWSRDLGISPNGPNVDALDFK